MKTEDDESRDFHEWLSRNNIPHTHIANEGIGGRRDFARTRKAKSLGQSAGFPDFLVVISNRKSLADQLKEVVNTYLPVRSIKPGKILGASDVEIYPNRLVAIEMKRQKGGKVSDKQKAWLETLNSAGIEAVVCKGFEEAKKFILDRVELNNNRKEF